MMGFETIFPGADQVLAQTVALGVAGGTLLNVRKPAVGKPSPEAKARARRLAKLAAKSRRRNRK